MRISLKSLLIIAVTALVVAVMVLLYETPTAQALSGTYIYASSEGYYYPHGPTGYWHTVTGEGFCGHISSSCSPNSMVCTTPAGQTPSTMRKGTT